MDVKALHTNIPNTEKTVATVITTFFILILTRNSFIFNSKFYLQIKGCVMGTICAPIYKKYSYPSSKRDASILSLKTNQLCAALHCQHFYIMDQIREPT